MKKKHASLLIGGGIVLVTVSLILSTSGAGSSKYLTAAAAGGDYLVTHMHEDGSFVYEYDPIARKESDSYNILRHAGTTYSLLELFEATNDERYLQGAKAALGYLRDAIVPCPVYRGALCVLEDDEIKLGGNGLALLAFAKYMELTGTRDDLDRARGLARFITAIQADNGEFIFFKMDGNGVPDNEFVSLYYPGEAIFGLARFSQLSEEREWMDTAHRGAAWIIDMRDKETPTAELEHDHWMLYAINELHADRPEPRYVAHAKRLTEAIVASQHPSTGSTSSLRASSGQVTTNPDWAGGYYNPPRSTPTATRNEGLGAAYELFVRANEMAYAQVARDAMERGIDFTLRTQFTPATIRETGAANDAVGGFHESLDEYTVRIDYVQHNISALLAFERMQRNDAISRR